MEKYREKLKIHVKREEILDDNLGIDYEVVWGQCSDQMRERVESITGYETVRNTSDVLWMIRLIKLL